MGDLASVSNHLTPGRLKGELEKLRDRDYPVFVINIKPMYRDKVIGQLEQAKLANVEVLEIGRVYEF
jgi:hypothetical protein